MKGSLPVMESFLSIQGEGHHQGTVSYFIRLAGCDVGCSWCDVKESWEIEYNQWQSINEITSEIRKTKAKVVIITGGEPLMHDLTDLTSALKKLNYKIHLETSGAYPLSGEFDWITLSPKKFKKALDDSYLKASELKMIVVNKNDLKFAEEESIKVNDNCLLYMQAEWDHRDKQYPVIYSYIAQNPKWKISLQSHKYLGLP